jgi:hypothetical protein
VSTKPAAAQDEAEAHCYKVLAALDMIPLAHHSVQRVRFVEAIEPIETNVSGR